MHMMNGYGFFGWIMIIFWIGLFILGILLITNYLNGGRKRTPLQILKERLAKGEISEAEYEQLKSVLERDKRG
ncbi:MULTISPECIES: SHOCT domain-containing protein [Virgibacillus]|uniref:Membrane protein n=2 Tax=Virgibacillus TaxID=84406 RepID=A0A1H9K975_9BACI|nr:MULTISPECIES: SHOCT domain-containing protein [Virgibacillus]SDQ94625.1 putative membrane protein [Virgibacillus salinus]SEQ95669.1 putative membrane protein [Virgibacillus subterraneus]